MPDQLTVRMAKVLICAALDAVWHKQDEPEAWVCEESGTGKLARVGPTVAALIERGLLAERPYRVDGRVWAEPTEDGVAAIDAIRANGGRPPRPPKPAARPRALNAAERDLLTAVAAGRELLFEDHFWRLVTAKGTSTRVVDNGRNLVESLVDRGFAAYVGNGMWRTGAKLTPEGEREGRADDAGTSGTSQNPSNNDGRDPK
jgi:hypothetical protein